MKKTSGIYQIVNNVTQKRYIGLASNMNSRKQGHIYDLRRNKHGNDYLQKAWNKYGEANFSFLCLEECDKTNLYKREDYWVKVLSTLDKYYGYNIKETNSEGRSLMTDVIKKKISATHKLNDNKPSKLCRANLQKYLKTND